MMSWSPRRAGPASTTRRSRFGTCSSRHCTSSGLRMPTTRSSAAVTQSLIDLAWSLWAELGVSGWTRHHADWNVDVEALIILTAALEDADPRLRDESTDWCIRYARFVSSARL